MLISLKGANIVLFPEPHPMMRTAARELSRYLYQLTGALSLIVESKTPDKINIELVSKRQDLPRTLDNTDDQGFILQASGEMLTITGETPLGVLYGVYSLLEHLGIGFFLGGDALPETQSNSEISSDLNIQAKPAFAVRGSNLHGNFIAGASGWSEDDWRYYIDQMARIRCNLFLLHLYGSEPGAGYEVNGEVIYQGPPHSSNRAMFGINPARTSEFDFGTGSYFDRETFGAPPVEAETYTGQISGMEEILKSAIRYGRKRGVYAAVGFEAPIRVDPANAKVREAFAEHVRQFIRRYPDLSYFCLWQCECHGILGEDMPDSDTARALFDQHKDTFAYLGGDRRIWAGIAFSEFAKLAYDVLQAEAPGMRMVVCGWGGDRWMRFADYAQGLDNLLPQDIIFTCHENVDITLSDTVSEAWGGLPPERERWAQPWIESDGEEMWTRQANVEPLSRLLPDALAKGCSGALCLHWRSRDFEEELRYLARFSWQPDIENQEFYSECARLMFGKDREEAMAEVLGDLQKLGGRWTGIHGGLECAGEFLWTGRTPHWAYEADYEAVDIIQKHAKWARNFLAENNLPEGSAAFAAISNRLTAILEPENIDMNDLREVEEEAYSAWLKLLPNDLPEVTWGIVHGVEEKLHHLTTRANRANRTNKLREIRQKLIKCRTEYPPDGDIHERFNFLLSTVDVVLALDKVSVTLAEPGPVLDLLTQAREAQKNGNSDQLLAFASQAYQAIVSTNVKKVLEAQTGKLTTQCEWAVLALMNLKMMPLYWKTLKQAEDLLPAVPPRCIHLRVKNDAVEISWESDRPAHGYHIYRRSSGSEFEKINREPVGADARWLPLWYPWSIGRMYAFIDQPNELGEYEYAITALDENGCESPMSHSEIIRFSLPQRLPGILGIKQDFSMLAGEVREVRAIVIPSVGDEITSVILHYRKIGEDNWSELPMLWYYKRAYHTQLPAFGSNTAAVEYYVEAQTQSGQSSRWPKDRHWTATLLENSSD